MSLPLYISFILHQTATRGSPIFFSLSCISPLSYIKPQLSYLIFADEKSCISPLSYIKPQLPCTKKDDQTVVFLLYPTSNRN